MAGTRVVLVYGLIRVMTVAVPHTFAVAPSRYVVKELIARPMAALAVPWSSAVLDAWRGAAYASDWRRTRHRGDATARRQGAGPRDERRVPIARRPRCILSRVARDLP